MPNIANWFELRYRVPVIDTRERRCCGATEVMVACDEDRAWDIHYGPTSWNDPYRCVLREWREGVGVFELHRIYCIAGRYVFLGCVLTICIVVYLLLRLVILHP